MERNCRLLILLILIGSGLGWDGYYWGKALRFDSDSTLFINRILVPKIVSNGAELYGGDNNWYVEKGAFVIERPGYNSALEIRGLGESGEASPNIQLKNGYGKSCYVRNESGNLIMFGDGLGYLQCYWGNGNVMYKKDTAATTKISVGNSSSGGVSAFQMNTSDMSGVLQVDNSQKNLTLWAYGNSQYRVTNLRYASSLGDPVFDWYVDSAGGWNPIRAGYITRDRQWYIEKSLWVGKKFAHPEGAPSIVVWSVVDHYLSTGSYGTLNRVEDCIEAGGIVSADHWYCAVDIPVKEAGGSVVIDSLFAYYVLGSYSFLDSVSLQARSMPSGSYSTVKTANSSSISGPGSGSINCITGGDYSVSNEYSYRVKFSYHITGEMGSAKWIGCRMVYHKE